MRRDVSGPGWVRPEDRAGIAEPVRLYRVPEAMALLSLSRSVLYEQIRAGRLKSVTQGRTRLIPATALADYVTLLLQEADGQPRS
jgi:excisionase family DNA binding protein